MNSKHIIMKNAQNSESIAVLIERIISYLPLAVKRKLIFTFIAIVFSAGMEVLSIASIIPFLSVLANPGQAINALSGFGMSFLVDKITPPYFAISLLALFSFTITITAIVRIATVRLVARISGSIANILSARAYAGLLYKPYSEFKNINSSDIVTVLTTHVYQSVVVINSSIQLISGCIISLSLIAVLLVIDWPVALTAATYILILYIFLMKKVRSKLMNNSKIINEKNIMQVLSLQETSGLFRDIYIDSTQSIFLDNYKEIDRELRKREAQNILISNAPRFILESSTLLFIGFTAFIIASNNSSSVLISKLGALALTAQRLLPSLQQGFANWAVIKSRSTSILTILSYIDPNQKELKNKIQSGPKGSKFESWSSIQLKNLSFSYNSIQNQLNSINCTIRRGEIVGVKGTTGGGKSTLLDIIMCLQEPTLGNILVDSIDLYKSNDQSLRVGWQSLISHVPQSIYLRDCSIAENIALGTPFESIDMDLIHEVCDVACIRTFIEGLPNQYSEITGENGTKLSGGQMQRIGIARALYKKSSLLILDEATSALDIETEKSVMDSITSYRKDITIVMLH